MKIHSYLKDHILDISLFLIGWFLIIFLFKIFKISGYLVIFTSTLMIFIALIIVIHDFYKRKKFYDELVSAIEKLDQKYLSYEVVKRPSFMDGEIIYDALYDICKNANEYAKSYKNTTSDYQEYIEKWCHEIKTPLAACKLIIENNPSPTNESISEELKRLEDNVEQVLYYARSKQVEKDYLISKVSLKELVSEVIKRNKKELIYKHVKVEMNFDDVDIYSDRKWLAFILNQIISNSIKYFDNDPLLRFEIEEQPEVVSLKIIDNGIGINEEDLARVFDKGFTGHNGRNSSVNSTGLGLYLCKQLCLKLHHDISVSSDRGTVVTINFPRGSYINETLQ